MHPPRIQAREAVSRFLGHPNGQAEKMVAELADDEVAAIVAAAGDKHTARQAIKDVFSRNHDRRSAAFAVEATRRAERSRRSSSARKVLDRELGLGGDSAVLITFLDEAEREILAGLELEHEVADVCVAVLLQASQRVARATPKDSQAIDYLGTLLQRFDIQRVEVTAPPAGDTVVVQGQQLTTSATLSVADGTLQVAEAATDVSAAEAVPEHADYPDEPTSLVGTGEP